MDIRAFNASGIPAPPAASAPAPVGEPCPVALLLDDDTAHRCILRALMEPHAAANGFRVAEAPRPSVARRLLARYRAQGVPVLVWSDERLADGSGMEFFRRLGGQPSMDQVTRVLASASAFGVDTEALNAAGVTRFIEKPLDLARYQAIVAEVVASWKRTWPPGQAPCPVAWTVRLPMVGPPAIAATKA